MLLNAFGILLILWFIRRCTVKSARENARLRVDLHDARLKSRALETRLRVSIETNEMLVRYMKARLGAMTQLIRKDADAVGRRVKLHRANIQN